MARPLAKGVELVMQAPFNVEPAGVPLSLAHRWSGRCFQEAERPKSARFWSAPVLWRFGSALFESGRGLPHSKTLSGRRMLQPAMLAAQQRRTTGNEIATLSELV